MEFCFNCMEELNDDTSVCPKCGTEISKYELNPTALPPYTILNGKYIVGKVLGQGGFGITYLGRDLNLKQKIAIKEYYPTELATRGTTPDTRQMLSVLSGNGAEFFKKGLDRFVKEAENLAKFNSLPGIVSVKDFFYENNTAYMVMEFLDGITLSKYLKDHGGKLPYDQVLTMMKPVMGSLQTVHDAGIIHRDISPDNIMVTDSGEIKLIDFGAARYVGNNDAKSLTVILKHGYAPPEQYQTNGKQGPWTDVYALAATMYRMITGEVPQESTDRVLGEDSLRAVKNLIPDVPQKMSDAIMHGLAVSVGQRPAGIADFAAEIENGKGIKKEYLIYGGVAAALVIVIIALIISFSDKKGMNDQAGSDNKNDIVVDDDKTDTENKNEEPVEEIVEEEPAGPLRTARHINYYRSRDDQDEVLHISEVGEMIEIYEPEKDGWIEIQYENDKAYIKPEYVVTEKDYDLWKESYYRILDTAGVDHDEDGVRVSYNLLTSDSVSTIYHSESLDKTDELLGLFDDFDGDGDKELFLNTCGADGEKLWFLSNGDPVCIELLGYFSSKLPYVVEVWQKQNAGRAKLIKAGIVTGGTGDELDHKSYIVNDEKVISVGSIQIGNVFGWPVRYESFYPRDYIKCYSDTLEVAYLSQCANRFFPTLILDGKIGECASCEISKDDFVSISGAQEIIDYCCDRWKDKENRYVEWPLDNSSGRFECGEFNINSGISNKTFNNGMIGIGQSLYPAEITVTDIYTSSFQYNEAGYFVINFNIPVEWDTWSGKHYKAIPYAEMWDGIYDKKTSSDNLVEYVKRDAGFAIDTLTGHAIVSFLNGKLELVYFFWGEQPLYSGEQEVLMWSDFSNFDIEEIRE